MVIGFDGRHKSQAFAKEMLRYSSAMGITTYLFERSIPTPLCAYATKNLKGDVGLMVTASHNPKMDNGIKLFQSNSAQVIGPLLKRLEAGMETAPARGDFMASHQKNLKSLSTKAVPHQILTLIQSN